MTSLASSVCPLVDEANLCKLPDGRKWWWEKTDLTLVGISLLSKTLIICWWVVVCSFPVNCLVWGDPARRSMGLHRRINGDLQEGSYQAALSRAQSLQQPLLTHAFRGGASTFGRFDSVSCRVTSPFPWVLVCTRFCLCPLRVKSLFPPVLWKSCNHILLAFRVRFPWSSQFLCQIPRLESLTWGSETFTTVGEL